MTSDPIAARAAQLARIRGLMAKTVDNGCTEAEAASAAAAVDRLLALYEIDLDEVTVREQPIRQTEIDLKDHPIRYAASDIARFCDCRVWIKRHTTTLVFFGFQVDTEIADYLTLIFRRAIDREISTVTLFNAEYMARTLAQQAGFRQSFGVGMAVRLGERLGELKSKRDFTQRENGRDLVLIKLPLVDSAMLARGITIGKAGRGGKPMRDHAAYSAGRVAANNVAINAGIAARAERGGRLR